MTDRLMEESDEYYDNHQATETPLIEMLRDIPSDYRGEWPMQWNEDGSASGHAMCPVGFLAHKAADTIASLESKLEELKELFEGAADAEYFTDSPNPVPNDAMRALVIIEGE